MSVFALGLNHTTAPLDLRGRFAFAPEQLRAGAAGACASALRRAAPEAAILSTCNRTELYWRRPPSARAGAPAVDWLAGMGGVAGASCCARTPTCCRTATAARHAFRVASGLDSMVLGEPQILGQMKQAVREADERRHARHHAAPAVPALLRGRQGSAHAPPRSARIRSAWPPRRCGWPRSCSRTCASIQVLFVGAGEMIELAATHFAAREPKAIAHRQPHAGARREAGQPLRRRGDAAGRPAGAPARVRRRGLAAPPARCRSSAWARSSAR